MKVKKCPECGNTILIDSENCPYCFAAQNTQAYVITCKNCGAKNINSSFYCFVCGNKLESKEKSES